MTLAGAPSSTAEVVLGRAVKARVTFDAAGTATATLRPTLVEFLANAAVRLHYVTASETGPDATVRIGDLVDRTDVIAEWFDRI
ncbi:hypothetical protein HLA99_16645 [Microbacterium ulmi]|uniref:Uncharacterized protein n=1 Tax=Microbacterium ulmi TaxID=179095 RepID=A0A7Y2Q1K8_9MICO|nr:hypothetical protein [Microbacterium ulmi]